MQLINIKKIMKPDMVGRDIVVYYFIVTNQQSLDDPSIQALVVYIHFNLDKALLDITLCF